MKGNNSKRIKEFGDFQTPVELTRKIIRYLKDSGVSPASIIEPTCGLGSFIQSACEAYPSATIIGFDINPAYVERAKGDIVNKGGNRRVSIYEGDFFKLNWLQLVRQLEKPVLIIGNPPWVTNAEISTINGTNLPAKTNIHGFKGMDARTGMSNFDISEWMIIKLLEAVNGQEATLSMLCKANVARRVLEYSFKNRLTVSSSTMHLIEAQKYFNAAVDACLFTCHLLPRSGEQLCRVYRGLDDRKMIQEIGFQNGRLIADLPSFQKWQHLQGNDSYTWRSGIKHDCSKVMELVKCGNSFQNGLGEQVTIEDDYLYPVLKSSDLANNRIDKTDRWMLVTQKAIGEDTSSIKEKAPLTWNYLGQHDKLLVTRASSIYKNQPPYSIFGVGPYTFSPWKVAISGFYKKFAFRLVHSLHGKPVVLDDTCYFLPCDTIEEAIVLFTALDHPIAEEFYKSFIFWDAKRPITKKVLQRLAVKKLVQEIGKEEMMRIIKVSDHNLDTGRIATTVKKLVDEKENSVPAGKAG